MSICFIAEVKLQWAMLVLGWVTVSVHYMSLMALQLTLLDQNPFRTCFKTISHSVTLETHYIFYVCMTFVKPAYDIVILNIKA